MAYRDCPVGPRNSTSQCLSSPLRNTDRTQTVIYRQDWGNHWTVESGFVKVV